MKASELIQELQEKIKAVGDVEVKLTDYSESSCGPSEVSYVSIDNEYDKMRTPYIRIS